MNQRYGMRPIFLEYQITTIQKVFKTSTLKLGAVCDVNSIQEQDGEHTQWEALYDKGSSLGYFLYDRFDKDPEQFSSNRFLDIGPYTNQVYLYKENMVQLREQLTFQVHILHIDSPIWPFVLFVIFLEDTFFDALLLLVQDSILQPAMRALLTVTDKTALKLHRGNSTVVFVGIHSRYANVNIQVMRDTVFFFYIAEHIYI